MCSSPRLIAACHVLLRLLMPRHSPCALISLTSSGQASVHSLPRPRESSLLPLSLLFLADPLRWALLGERSTKSLVLMNYAGFTEVCFWLHCFYPFLRTAPAALLKVPQFCFLPSVACFAYFPSALFSFQGADLPTHQGQSLVLSHPEH